MTRVAGEWVLVTGAASGIGRLLVVALRARGAKVIAWDRDAQGLAALAEGDEAVAPRTLDLSDHQAIYSAASAELAAGRVPRVVINNAGIVQGKTLLEADPQAIERTFAVNALAPIHLTRAFLPAMLKAGGGHVVTVASAGGIVGTARLVDYCASKFAAVGFDEALRLEAQRNGWPLRTTLVAPWYIDTGMFAGVRSRIPWLLPILRPDDVCQRIMDAIERDRRRLVMPGFVLTSYLLRMVPVALFDKVMDWLGVSQSMDQFRGRSSNGQP